MTHGQEAEVVLTGVFPIGGTVNGVCQLAHHKNKKNRLEHGQAVTVTERTSAIVTTYGEFHNGDTIHVVKVAGKEGWYTESAFRFH